jgi:exopolysaccharide biosynthesis WecB/TagA/CpsF family protein
MNPIDAFSPAKATRPTPGKLSRDTVFLIGDLLPLLDFFGVLLAAWVGTLLYAGWVVPGAATAGILEGGGRAALAAAVLAPLLLCDRAFVAFASAGRTAALIRCYVVRFLMFTGVVAALGLASRHLAELPPGWLALWFAATLAVTALTRLQLVALLRRLERSGTLVESIAVVGAGPVADRLIRHLGQTRGDSVDVLGVFDDRATRSEGALHPSTGSVSDLLELGKTRPPDWILLTLPAGADDRLQGLVHRLKAVASPVGLCSQDVGLDTAAGDGQTVARPRWDTARDLIENVLPPWIITLLLLPLTALRRLLRARARSHRRHATPLTLTLDDYDLDRFSAVARDFGQQRFGYIVNPNADHLIRLHSSPRYRALLDDAAYVLLDSRFLAHLLRLTRKLTLPVCAGSDLTARLFAEVIAPEDRLVLIGGSAGNAARLAGRYGLKQLAHLNPPMGFIHDPRAVEECLRFVEAHSPFRYCLLAIGSPQQEVIAQKLKARGVARGLALCIGASIDFLTGVERRAPRWMRRYGLEWLFRLSQSPGRMAGRYLVRGPRLFRLLRRTHFVVRPAVASPAPATPAAPPVERLPETVGRRAVSRAGQAVRGHRPDVRGKTGHGHTVQV